MSTTHSFNVDHAKIYGLRESILIHNLHFWVAHNYANGRHEHDGRTWTYNSVSAFESLFPYLTYKQIRTSLETLITLSVLVRGYYGTNPADRSSWYAFTDEFLAENPLPERFTAAKRKGTPSAPQGKCPSAPQGTPSALQGKSLEEQMVNTDSKQKEKSAFAPAPLAKQSGFPIPDDVNAQTWADFLQVRKAKKAPITVTALAGIRREAVKAGIDLNTAIAACCEFGWQGFNAQWYAERIANQVFSAPARRAAQPRTPAPENFNASVYGQGGKL